MTPLCRPRPGVPQWASAPVSYTVAGTRPLRLDGGGESLGCLLAVVVGEPHGEGVGACCGRCSGELVVGVARVAEGLQFEPGRELPGSHRSGVGPDAAAEEKFCANAPPTIPVRLVPPLALMVSGRFWSTRIV